MVYKFFHKKSAASGVANNEIKQNLQLAEELHKLIIKNCLKNNCLFRIQRQCLGDDLVYMQLISKFNEGFRFLLCVIDIL